MNKTSASLLDPIDQLVEVTSLVISESSAHKKIVKVRLLFAPVLSNQEKYGPNDIKTRKVFIAIHR